MSKRKYSFLPAIVLLLSSHFVSTQEIRNKICIENYDRDACQQIARDQEFACTEDTSSVNDCFLSIDEGLPQFAVVKPENALLAAPLVSDNVVVIAEIHSVNPPYRTAVIVRKPYDGGFENLRGKRFCHPGFKHDELVTRRVLEEFESAIINLNRNYCDTGDNSTIVEKRVRAIANFFGSSCRPGTWTYSDDLDAELKTKHSSLCDLCGVDRCNVNYQVPFNDTLLCLTNRGGDIAITTLNDAALFFNSSSNAENFQYLCRNGSVSNSANPCTWTDQLNPLLVTGRDNAASIKSFIQNKLPNYVGGFNLQSASQDVYVASLAKILRLEKSNTINFIEPVSLSSYVPARRSVPSVDNSVQCDSTVKWCTLNNNEQQKCTWLQQAALNAGFQPVIKCVQSQDTDVLSCLNDIKNERADIAFADINYGYTSLKKGLKVVAYTETDTRQLSVILIVVRANSTDIKSLDDLKGRRACFPEYGGKEWLADIDTLRSKKVVENNCDYGKLFSDFVGSSCVPGANSRDYEIENADQGKLCSQCIPINNTLPHAYCSADDGNKYYGTDGALRCLSAQAGDYAVITRNDVVAYVNNSSDFRVLSKNGSLAEIPGFNVDEEAALTIITAGGIIAKNSTLKEADIVLLLRGIEAEFGQRLEKPFKVFESFDYAKDLLFPDSTPGLTFGGTTIKYVDNFKTLLSNSEKCISKNDPGGALAVIPSTVLIFVAVYFVLRLC